MVDPLEVVQIQPGPLRHKRRERNPPVRVGIPDRRAADQDVIVIATDEQARRSAERAGNQQIAAPRAPEEDVASIADEDIVEAQRSPG